LNPTTPLKAAGIRMEPAMSDPLARVVSPAARLAAEPPEDPPAEYSVFQGLRVTPQRRGCVNPAQQNSGVVVRTATGEPHAMHTRRAFCMQ
jgi:hypothetical protein